MINEYCSILIPGVATIEIQIVEVNDDFIRGRYDDNEKVFIRQSAINCYWPDRGRKEAKERAKEAAKKRMATIRSKD